MCVTLCKAVPNQLMYFSHDAMFLRCYIDFVRQFGAPICDLVKYFRLEVAMAAGECIITVTGYLNIYLKSVKIMKMHAVNAFKAVCSEAAG